MKTRVVKNTDVSYLDSILSKPVSCKELAKIDAIHISIWCAKNGVYQIVTTELIEWLENEICDKDKALEIGSGGNRLHEALGIRGTDSYIQQDNIEVMLVCASMGQAITNPPSSVERIPAEDAVAKYQPEVVIGSWITEKFIDGVSTRGNIYGPIEEDIVRQARYILIGNIGSHGDKRIMKLPHKTYSPKCLVSRAANQKNNRIWIWEKQQP